MTKCNTFIRMFVKIKMKYLRIILGFFNKLSVRYYGENKEKLGKALLHLTAVGKLKRVKTTCNLPEEKKIYNNRLFIFSRLLVVC